MEQALLVVQAIDSCAATQLHNHSAPHKGVRIREPRARFSDVCRRDVSHRPSAGLHWGCSTLVKLGYVSLFEGVECKLKPQRSARSRGSRAKAFLMPGSGGGGSPPSPAPGEVECRGKVIWTVELTWFDPMDKGGSSMKGAFRFEPGSAWHSRSFNCHGESVRRCVVTPVPRGAGQGHMWEARTNTCLWYLVIGRQFLEGRSQGDRELVRILRGGGGEADTCLAASARSRWGASSCSFIPVW